MSVMLFSLAVVGSISGFAFIYFLTAKISFYALLLAFVMLIVCFFRLLILSTKRQRNFFDLEGIIEIYLMIISVFLILSSLTTAWYLEKYDLFQYLSSY